MIYIFIRSLTKGGSEKQALILSSILKSNYKVKLVVFYGSLIDKNYLVFIDRKNIEVIKLNGSFLKKLYSFYKLLKINKIKIIFSYLLTDNFLGAIIGRVAGVKYIIGGIRNSRLPWGKLLISKLLNNYLQDITIFNNEYGRDIFVNNYGFKNSKCITIQNCYDAIPRTTVKKEKNDINILSVGRFVKQKDYDTLLRSIEELKNNFSLRYHFKFFIIGYGELEKHIRNKILERNLSDIVVIKINPLDLDKYFDRADIYISTSIFEGFSNSIMEAMAFSLPIITTDVGDNKYLVKENFNGFLIEKYNHKSAAHHLSSLINSYDLRIEMGQNSLNHLKANYSKEKFSNKYYSLINSLISPLSLKK